MRAFSIRQNASRRFLLTLFGQAKTFLNGTHQVACSLTAFSIRQSTSRRFLLTLFGHVKTFLKGSNQVACSQTNPLICGQTSTIPSSTSPCFLKYCLLRSPQTVLSASSSSLRVRRTKSRFINNINAVGLRLRSTARAW